MNAKEHTFQYVTGVNKRSQQRGSLKDEVYICRINSTGQSGTLSGQVSQSFFFILR